MMAPKSPTEAEELSGRSWELNSVIARIEVKPEVMKNKTLSRLRTYYI